MASQRSEIRDLHDLSEVAGRQFDRDLLRSLAVIKLWESDQDNLDYAKFVAQLEGGKDYDLGDLINLLREDQRPNLNNMIRCAKDGFRFLEQLTEILISPKLNRNTLDSLSGSFLNERAHAGRSSEWPYSRNPRT